MTIRCRLNPSLNFAISNKIWTNKNSTASTGGGVSIGGKFDVAVVKMVQNNKLRYFTFIVYYKARKTQADNTDKSIENTYPVKGQEKTASSKVRQHC